MKHLKYVFAAMTPLVFAACDKDDDPVFVPALEFATDKLSADAAGGILSVEVKADMPYEVVMPQEAEWVKLAEEAQAEATLSFEVEKNTAATARTAAVVIRASESVTPADTLLITQSGLDDAADITAEFDPKFAALLEYIRLIPDAKRITYADVKDIKFVNANLVSARFNLNSVRGIEYMESLIFLNLEDHRITSLDVSHNTKLKYLYVGTAMPAEESYRLSPMNLSKNTELEVLVCDNARQTELDVSHNTKLKTLYCTNNQLTSLDLRQNTALTTLGCNNNELASLDVSHCPELESLYASYNPFSTLDLSHNTKLTHLECVFPKVQVLDLSHNTELQYLRCQFGELTTLDVSRCTKLVNLFCYDNRITSLDLSGCTELAKLYCNNNRLTSLDVSRCTELKELCCAQNLLTGVDISHNRALTGLFCIGNPGQDGSFKVSVWPGCELKATDFSWKEVSAWEYNGQTVTVEYIEK